MRSLRVRRKRGCKADGAAASEIEIEPGDAASWKPREEQVLKQCSSQLRQVLLGVKSIQSREETTDFDKKVTDNFGKSSVPRVVETETGLEWAKEIKNGSEREWQL